jgi:hypothetical protein
MSAAELTDKLGLRSLAGRKVIFIVQCTETRKKKHLLVSRCRFENDLCIFFLFPVVHTSDVCISRPRLVRRSRLAVDRAVKKVKDPQVPSTICCWAGLSLKCLLSSGSSKGDVSHLVQASIYRCGTSRRSHTALQNSKSLT